MAKANGLLKYNILWDLSEPLSLLDSAAIELKMAFHRPYFKADGWLGRFNHLRNGIDLLWNEPRRRDAIERRINYDPRKHDAFIWNDWTERMMRGYCENDEVIVAGPGASWKTTSGALFFYCLYLSSPLNTRIILTSTTGDGLRARVWKELVHFHRTSQMGIGNLVQSRTMIQTVKGEDGAGIFGIAVESDGDVDKAVNKIIGRHNTNMGVFVDEMPTVNNAIVDACVNLETGAERLQFGGVGNPDSQLDPHGMMAEPENGWDSVSEETESWKTKRGGLCICLNGRNSPRIGDDDLYPGLIRQIDLDKTIERYGEDSPQFWKQRIGFWAPAGISKGVFTSAIITKFRAREKPIWVSGFKQGLALDPSFGGYDRCVLRRIKCGEITDGTTVLAPANPPIIIKLSASVQNPIPYQITEAVKRVATEHDIPPDMIATDSSGAGGTLLGVMIREIGVGILGVDFGGRATPDPVSETNPKPGNLEYYNRVTQLWYFLLRLMMNGQVRDLDLETATELCKRPQKQAIGSSLIQLQPKSEMMGRSPDFADALVVGAELFRKRGFLGSIGGEVDVEVNEKWRDFARKYDVVSDYLVA